MTGRDTHIPTGRRRFIKAAGASAVTIGLAGCSSGGGGGDGGDGTPTKGKKTTGSSGGSDVEEVIIGSNHPLSGFLASTGTGMHNAIRLAAQVKNENGGIQSLGGAKVKVIKGDNQGKQELGGQVSQELIDKGAHVLTGCYSSPVTTAATQVAERQKTPFVISIAADDSILQGRGLNYVYRPQPPAKKMAQDYATFVPELIRNAGKEIKTAGLFYVNNSYGQAIRKHLKNFLPKHGVEVTVETALEFGSNSANTQVSKLKAANPDAVIATTYAPGGVTLAKAMQDQDYRPKYFTGCASATFTDDDAIADIGKFANGVLDNNYALNPTIEKTAKVKSKFTSQFDQEFSASVGMAYTAAEVIIAGIEAAGSADKGAINKAIQNLSFDGHIAAMGSVEFKQNGENKNAMAPVNQVIDQQVKVVYPEQFAETKPQV